MRSLILSFVALSAVTPPWVELPPMPQAEAGGAVAWLGETLAVAGGTAWRGSQKLFLPDTQLFDAASGRWRIGPPLPHALAYGPSVASAAGLEIFGGVDGTGARRDSWQLDTAGHAWSRTGTAPADVLLGRAAQVGEQVFLLGGCPDVADLTRCSDVVWRRTADGTWLRSSTLPGGPLALHAVAVIDPYVYVFGGCSMPVPGQVQNHDGAYRYDTRDDTWRTLPALPRAARGMAAAAHGSRIYLVGGYTDGGFSAEVFVYDAATRRYEPFTPLPAPLMGGEVALHRRTLYAVGGEDKPRSRSARLLRVELPAHLENPR